MRITKTTTAVKTLDVLQGWLATHNILEQTITDKGAQVTSKEFATFTMGNRIDHTKSIHYHPAKNSLAERSNLEEEPEGII